MKLATTLLRIAVAAVYSGVTPCTSAYHSPAGIAHRFGVNEPSSTYPLLRRMPTCGPAPTNASPAVSGDQVKRANCVGGSVLTSVIGNVPRP